MASMSGSADGGAIALGADTGAGTEEAGGDLSDDLSGAFFLRRWAVRREC